MEPGIVNIPQRKLIGKRRVTSFADDHTPELWRSFMPLRQSMYSCSDDLFSVTVYPKDFFDRFDATATFEKWAAVETVSSAKVPENVETLIVPEGKYAVFHYKGSSADAPKIFGYIFNEWLPRSGFALDDRPHFEILGKRYKNADPDSEEDIYIPIKPK